MGFGTQEENLKATTELGQQLAAESSGLVLPCFCSLLHTRVFVGPCQSESLQLADPTENLVCNSPDPRSSGGNGRELQVQRGRLSPSLFSSLESSCPACSRPCLRLGRPKIWGISVFLEAELLHAVT